MKILLDTNVILDYLLRRVGFYEDAKRVIESCLFRNTGYIAAHSFSDMFYMLHETEKQSVEYCRSTFIKLCKTFEICAIDKTSIMNAAQNLSFDDFEDALQADCAALQKVDCIVTRNPDDFKGAAVEVLTPADFLKTIA